MDQLMTAPEACSYLRIKRSYLYKLTMRGVIPFIKPNGGRLLFDRGELEAWLRTNRHPGKREREEVAATHIKTHAAE